LSKQRCEELWEKLNKPQLAVPEHVVRAKAQLVEVLIEQLRASIKAVKIYNHRVESFFASSPAAQFAKTLPGGKSGTLVAAVWAELGDAQGRWESSRHLQAEAGAVPVTKASGKSRGVTSICATRCTGFPLSRSTTVSGPSSTTGARGITAIAITKRCVPWEPSGSRLSLSCGETINLTTKTTTWPISPVRRCVRRRERFF